MLGNSSVGKQVLQLLQTRLQSFLTPSHLQAGWNQRVLQLGLVRRQGRLRTMVHTNRSHL